MNKDILQSLLSFKRPLVPYAHPIYSVRSARVMAQEMLFRFKDDNGEMLTVGTIFSDATIPYEQKVSLDMLCLDAAFKLLSETVLVDRMHFINLEPSTLAHPDFWTHLPRWVGGLEVNPGQVVVEFTESHSLHRLDELQVYAKRLRDHGLKIAVDDLGAGVASLTHMARLAPDFIKADRSLVEQVHRRPYQAALLNALAHFAEHMRVGFIAEGVELYEELIAVMDADVPWVQGFVYGHPEPILDLEAAIKAAQSKGQQAS